MDHKETTLETQTPFKCEDCHSVRTTVMVSQVTFGSKVLETLRCMDCRGIVHPIPQED
jgi:hypothetical protein